MIKDKACEALILVTRVRIPAEAFIKFRHILKTYKDRLTQYGYKYLKQYICEFEVDVKYLDTLDKQSPESEMVEDLVIIIPSFSRTFYKLMSCSKQLNLNQLVLKNEFIDVLSSIPIMLFEIGLFEYMSRIPATVRALLA